MQIRQFAPMSPFSVITEAGRFTMDIMGFGGLLEKHEQYFGKRWTSVILMHIFY